VAHEEHAVVVPGKPDVTVPERLNDPEVPIEDLRGLGGPFQVVDRRQDKDVGRRHNIRHNSALAAAIASVAPVEIQHAPAAHLERLPGRGRAAGAHETSEPAA
jgi:hypothetical protein